MGNWAWVEIGKGGSVGDVGRGEEGGRNWRTD